MSSSEESSEKSVRKTKKVVCNCPKCQGKYVDPRTRQDHMELPEIGEFSKVTRPSSLKKRKHKEEPLPEFPKSDSSENEDSDNSDSDGSENNSSKNNNSEINSSEINSSGSRLLVQKEKIVLLVMMMKKNQVPNL